MIILVYSFLTLNILVRDHEIRTPPLFELSRQALSLYIYEKGGQKEHKIQSFSDHDILTVNTIAQTNKKSKTTYQGLEP